ncbi:DinB family protein [Mangrovibacillus cuniculi]|uniref:DinB family protein n=1 Tax=Mangrovibacillus cuniculi TaxID=2593652 RepID=A0A7S8CA59_9BACI|nr:DinB family protein [Mangrovibacillus cuniculi]QPC46091.1 DinB family protein [Mangrovibacillus cuniculi]
MNNSLSNVRDTLIQLIIPLTYEQLNWKPTQSNWSVAQVVLHVAEAEARFLKLVETAVQEKNSEVQQKWIFLK